jgi:hypothetical protein
MPEYFINIKDFVLKITAEGAENKIFACLCHLLAYICNRKPASMEAYMHDWIMTGPTKLLLLVHWQGIHVPKHTKFGRIGK